MYDAATNAWAEMARRMWEGWTGQGEAGHHPPAHASPQAFAHAVVIFQFKLGAEELREVDLGIRHQHGSKNDREKMDISTAWSHLSGQLTVKD